MYHVQYLVQRPLKRIQWEPIGILIFKTWKYQLLNLMTGTQRTTLLPAAIHTVAASGLPISVAAAAASADADAVAAAFVAVAFAAATVKCCW